MKKSIILFSFIFSLPMAAMDENDFKRSIYDDEDNDSLSEIPSFNNPMFLEKNSYAQRKSEGFYSLTPESSTEESTLKEELKVVPDTIKNHITRLKNGILPTAPTEFKLAHHPLSDQEDFHLHHGPMIIIDGVWYPVTENVFTYIQELTTATKERIEQEKIQKDSDDNFLTLLPEDVRQEYLKLNLSAQQKSASRNNDNISRTSDKKSEMSSASSRRPSPFDSGRNSTQRQSLFNEGYSRSNQPRSYRTSRISSFSITHEEEGSNSGFRNQAQERLRLMQQQQQQQQQNQVTLNKENNEK